MIEYSFLEVVCIVLMWRSGLVLGINVKYVHNGL